MLIAFPDAGGSDFQCDPEDFISSNQSNANKIFPCGLVAWSLFNDTFVVSVTPLGSNKTTPLTLSQNGIAWPKDTKQYSSAKPVNFNDNDATRGGLSFSKPLDAFEPLMVWMRTAAMVS